ncbi:MAG: hypothetical protein IPP07_07970 [Holophagales bacterium]|nr:hypothetical protein [Holophagales bacterium]
MESESDIAHTRQLARSAFRELRKLTKPLVWELRDPKSGFEPEHVLFAFARAFPTADYHRLVTYLGIAVHPPTGEDTLEALEIDPKIQMRVLEACQEPRHFRLANTDHHSKMFTESAAPADHVAIDVLNGQAWPPSLMANPALFKNALQQRKKLHSTFKQKLWRGGSSSLERAIVDAEDVATLPDEIRNTLDTLLFPLADVFALPVALLGSPLLVSYVGDHDDHWISATAPKKPVVIERLYEVVVPRLEDVLLPLVIDWLFRIAQRYLASDSSNATPAPVEWASRFLVEAGGLLWAIKVTVPQDEGSEAFIAIRGDDDSCKRYERAHADDAVWKGTIVRVPTPWAKTKASMALPYFCTLTPEAKGRGWVNARSSERPGADFELELIQNVLESLTGSIYALARSRADLKDREEQLADREKHIETALRLLEPVKQMAHCIQEVEVELLVVERTRNRHLVETVLPEVLYAGVLNDDLKARLTEADLPTNSDLHHIFDLELPTEIKQNRLRPYEDLFYDLSGSLLRDRLASLHIDNGRAIEEALQMLCSSWSDTGDELRPLARIVEATDPGTLESQFDAFVLRLGSQPGFRSDKSAKRVRLMCVSDGQIVGPTALWLLTMATLPAFPDATQTAVTWTVSSAQGQNQRTVHRLVGSPCSGEHRSALSVESFRRAGSLPLTKWLRRLSLLGSFYEVLKLDNIQDGVEWEVGPK